MRPAWLTLLLLPTFAVASEPDVRAALAEEVRDAAQRDTAELREHIEDLETMARTIERLTARQEQYIRQLEERIRALSQAQREGDEG